MIVNPNAGKKRGLQTAEASAKNLAEAGITCKILVSEYPGNTVEIAASISLEDYDAVAAVGGDGTLFETINGLMKNRDIPPEIPVTQIPVGTGNSFIRDLGISNADEAVRAISGGKIKEVDLGVFSYNDTSFYFINLLGAGFVSNVAYRAGKYKYLGALSYIIGVIQEVAVLKSSEIELEIDGETFRRNAVFTEICNSKYTGGNMMMAPDAEIDSGYLEVVILNHVSRLKLLSLFPSIFSGKHILDKSVETFRGREISLKTEVPLALTPDGETFGTTPLKAAVVPHRIKMFI